MPTTVKNTPPEHLSLTASMQIEVVAEAGADGKPPLPRFNMVAYTGGPMKVAGWRAPVVIDLAGLAIPSQNRPIRFGHDANNGVGHTDTIRIADGRLLAAGLISRDTPAAREVVISAKNGFPWQASVGTTVDQSEFVKDKQVVHVNGREFIGPVNVVRKGTLGEISFVDLGADGNTSASVAAQIAPQNNTITNQENNMSESTASVSAEASQSAQAIPGANPAPADQSVQGAAVAPAAQNGSAATPTSAPSAPASHIQAAATVGDTGVTPDPVADLRKRYAAEQERIAAIQDIFGDKYPMIRAQAIKEGWDKRDAEVAFLRADRPQAPAGQAPEMPPVTGMVLEAAAALAAHMDDVEKVYDERTLDVAAKQFRGGIGLQELLLQAAWAHGYTGRTFRDTRAILKAAFYGEPYADPYSDVRGEGGFSTVDMSGILSNLANKFLLKGFFSVEQTWRRICAVRAVKDFKTAHSYRLIGLDQYEPVAPGGELKHGTLGNESYTNKADTYGLMLSIDRRDIINDDLGAITTVPRKLGRGSGLKINDVFWTIFLNNAAFFTSGNKNALTGANTILGIDGLTNAETLFLNQVDSEGKPIGVMPAILLVPTNLSAMGTQLFKALEIRDTTANTKYPVANPHAGKFRSEVSRYIGNSYYTGSSTTAWYLLADPEDLALIEVAFLNGQESPTIETALADFDTLGIKMRGYHDFGVALQDYRAGVRSAGA